MITVAETMHGRLRPVDMLRMPWFWAVLIPLVLATAYLAGRFILAPAPLESMAGDASSLRRPAEGFGLFDAPREEVKQETPAASAPVSATDARKIIHTATLEIRVASAARAAEELGRMAREAGGYIQSSNTTALDQGGHSAELVLRIPAARFEAFLSAAGGLGRVARREIAGQDVTADYVDQAARLRAWKSEESQLLVLMTRAKTVGEVLSVRERLSQVRETIEQIEGRLRYYDHYAALATVSITLFERSKPRSLPPLLGELAGMGRVLYASVRVLLLVVMASIPWLLAGWGLWRLVKRRRAARE
ncbi:MAG: DUF4349 domain-containing protein [Bacteroidota bacterium]